LSTERKCQWDNEDIMTPIALSIAGSDPSGGAGIQADLKTFHQREVYGMSVITLITIQNTKGVKEVIPIKSEHVLAQLETLLEDMVPQAIKTGALGTAQVVRAVVTILKRVKCALVIDPVIASTRGTPLLEKEAYDVLKYELLPLATLITPNLDEAGVLSGLPVTNLESMKTAAKKMTAMGAKSVLVKGGHLIGEATDVLYHAGKIQVIESPRVQTKHTHGTGCAFSAVITAEIAKGHDIPTAVQTAKKFISEAIKTNPGIGTGVGPLNYHAAV